MNTHSAHIIGKDFSVFIDGIPDKCDHKWSGDIILESASGKKIYWHTYRQWASLTDRRYWQQLVHEYHNKIEDPIISGYVCCSKCKKPFQPELF